MAMFSVHMFRVYLPRFCRILIKKHNSGWHLHRKGFQHLDVTSLICVLTSLRCCLLSSLVICQLFGRLLPCPSLAESLTVLIRSGHCLLGEDLFGLKVSLPLRTRLSLDTAYVKYFLIDIGLERD